MFDAPGVGPLELAWTERALVELRFSRGSTGPEDGLAEVPAFVAEPLTQYFLGAEIDPAAIPVELSGTPFELAVWRELRSIGRGEVRTYASVARAIGSPRAMRAVGGANARNPLAIVVPCHRVVAQGSKLGGYTGGLDRKRFLLALEGVLVEKDQVHAGQLVLERPSGRPK